MGRSDWIHIALVLHVMGAIVGLGTNLTYGLITSVGDRAGGERRVFALGLVQVLDKRLANPAYMAQLVTGLILVWLLRLNLFATSWLLLGLLLYIAVAVLGITVYAPVLRRQVCWPSGWSSMGATRTSRPWWSTGRWRAARRGWASWPRPWSSRS